MEVIATILIALVGMIVGVYLILNGFIRKEALKNATQDEQIKGLRYDLEKTNEEMVQNTATLTTFVKETLEKRNGDNLEFARTMSKLNETLIKFEMTLSHIDKTLREKSSKAEEDIRNLHNRINTISGKNG